MARDAVDVAARGPRLGWVLGGILVAAVLAHALWAASAKVTSDDLWWDLAAGRWIVEHGALPESDVFSYTHAGKPWQNGEWLAHVVLFAAYDGWGGNGVAIVKFAAIVAVFALVSWTAWRRSDSLVLAAGAVIFAADVCRPFFDIRAQLFLFLCAAASLAVIEAYRRGARAWVLALLPAIMVVWVNAHYSFLFGCGMVLLYAGCEVGKAWLGLPGRVMEMARCGRLAVAAVATVAAGLVNPYGVRAFTYPLLLLGEESLWRYDFLEWQPPVLFVEGDFNPAVFGWFLAVQAIAAAAALALAWRRFDVGDALLVATTVVMALSTRRFIPLFAVVSVPFLAQNLAVLRDRLGLARAARWGGLGAAAAAALLTVALFWRGLPVVRRDLAPGFLEGLNGSDYFPAGAADFLRRNPQPARLFHPYTWGGYLMFHAPDRQVFIDGRAQTVYPFAFYAEGQIAERGAAEWSAVLDRWQVSLLAWPSSRDHGERYQPLLRHLAASPSWVRVYDDGQAAVFAHTERGGAWAESFRRLDLSYPDVQGAQLFLVNAHVNAGDYEGGREQIRALLARFPAARGKLEAAQQAYLDLARRQDAAAAWFGLGFFRDATGDADGAAEAFRRALDRGLADPAARAYAEAALVRLPAGSPK